MSSLNWKRLLRLITISANIGPKKIIVYGKDIYEVINVSDIRYFEAAKSATLIYIDRPSPIITSKNLGQFEEMLIENSQFLRVHKSFLVNIDHIKQIKKEDGNWIIMEHKKLIPTSADRIKEIIAILNK